MWKSTRTLVLALAVVASLGSAAEVKPQYELSKHGPARTARDEKCDVPVLATTPRRDYVELGIFDVPKQEIGIVSDEDRRKGYDSHEGPKSVADLLWVVGPRACKLGADALLAEVNGLGFYMRAVAIAWVESDPPAASEPPDAKPASAP
jgi:hypothetical protein